MGLCARDVTDDEPALMTVRDRLSAAGVSGERIQQHMTAGPYVPSASIVGGGPRARKRSADAADDAGKGAPN